MAEGCVGRTASVRFVCTVPYSFAFISDFTPSWLCLTEKKERLVCGRLYDILIERVRNKLDDPVRVALLEALAGRFVWLGEIDLNPRPIQAGRIGCPGRG